MSKDNFESKCRRKCFWESNLLTGNLLKNVLGWIFPIVFLLKMTSWACFVGSGLKLIFHWKSELFISFRLVFRLLAVLSGPLTVENRYVSSANNLSLHWWSSGNSLMYIWNKSGPNIELWGTPAMILTEDELWSLRITLCFLFFQKSVKRLNKFPEVALRLCLWIIPSCYTLSKAFEMSRNTSHNYHQSWKIFHE